MRSSRLCLRSMWFASTMLVAAMIVAAPSITEADCPDVPALCGMTCSPDAFGTPIFCANGQCSCAPGYDTQNAPGGGLVCQPTQPEVIGTESNHYSCPGICPQATTSTWATVGSIYDAFDLVPVHGIAPGGEAFMPVWGHQANFCGNHGVEIRTCQGGSQNGVEGCSTNTDCPGGKCVPFLTCVGGGNNGQFCSTAADCPSGTCSRFQTWAGCAPDAFVACYGIQESDEGGFDYPSCDSSKGCGDNCGDLTCVQEGPDGCEQFDNRCKYLQPPDSASPGTTGTCNICNECVSDLTSAWPYIDKSTTCQIGSALGIDANTVDPARIDFPNNVIVYRAPTRWEDFSDFFDNPIDDDYTWDMEGAGHELFDTDTQFEYHRGCTDQTHGRIHIEFSSSETVDHFTDDDWGAANQFWRALRCEADETFCDIGAADRTETTKCWIKQWVNPDLVCPTASGNIGVDDDCTLHDPMVVAVGIPSLDCADDPYHGTDEIHPVLAMAIRIQEDLGRCQGGGDNTAPCNSDADCAATCLGSGLCSGRAGGSCQSDADCLGTCVPAGQQWAFFYRQHGATGPCGSTQYSRCLSDFKLPLGLPVVPANSVLTGADVHVDWHPWADTGTFGGGPSADVKVQGSTTSPVEGDFDLTNGAVVNIHLPHQTDGVVGLVTITPTYDSTTPQITCPGNINKPPDLGTCGAVATFTPTVTDNCSASAICNPPSGSAFPIGKTNVTCTATDQAGLMSAPCNFNVTVTAGNKCPHDQGYWKNHSGAWPINSLKLGTVTYSKAQLLSILNNSTTGDASVIVARAEIATLLSLANGSNPTAICGTIADANAALDGSTVPAKVGPKTTLGQRMVADANTLTSYDSGSLTPGCTP